MTIVTACSNIEGARDQGLAEGVVRRMSRAAWRALANVSAMTETAKQLRHFEQWEKVVMHMCMCMHIYLPQPFAQPPPDRTNASIHPAINSDIGSGIGGGEGTVPRCQHHFNQPLQTECVGSKYTGE